jgi:hypothetical protein
VGQSIKAMKKIKLNLNIKSAKNPSQEEIQNVYNHQRKYSNLALSSNFPTNIKLSLDLLVDLSERLISLKLNNIKGTAINRITKKSIQFPKLKSLNISDFSVPLMKKLLASCKLEELSLVCGFSTVLDVLCLAMAQSNLKILKVRVTGTSFRPAWYPDCKQINQLPVNKSITIASIFNDPDLMEVLLPRLPNIEQISVNNLITHQFHMIAETAMQLRILHNWRIKGSQLLQPWCQYSQMKKNKHLKFNHDIKFITHHYGDDDGELYV